MDSSSSKLCPLLALKPLRSRLMRSALLSDSIVVSSLGVPNNFRTEAEDKREWRKQKLESEEASSPSENPYLCIPRAIFLPSTKAVRVLVVA